jgi:hypothetical protein
LAESPVGITELLRRWQTGEAEAESRVFDALMPELRVIAARCFRNERPGHTLQPTALVNEAYFRLARAKTIEWQPAPEGAPLRRDPEQRERERASMDAPADRPHREEHALAL